MCVWMEGQLVCICVKGSAFSTIPQFVYTYWNDVMPLACVYVCVHVFVCVCAAVGQRWRNMSAQSCESDTDLKNQVSKDKHI